MTPEELYQRAWKQPSDINEHVPTLREYASHCQHITEFGTRYGVSTIALLSGCQRVISYDLHRTSFVEEIYEAFPEFLFVLGNTLHMDIAPTDLLFIDTLHTASQLFDELIRHHHQVSRYIICHDTVTFGEHGEGGGYGLRFALQQFISSNPQWRVIAEFTNNNGLTILERSQF